MAKSKKTLEITQTKTKANRQEIQINDMDYTTSAEPKAFADGRPVFCAHDKIVPIKELRVLLKFTRARNTRPYWLIKSPQRTAQKWSVVPHSRTTALSHS